MGEESDSIQALNRELETEEELRQRIVDLEAKLDDITGLIRSSLGGWFGSEEIVAMIKRRIDKP